MQRFKINVYSLPAWQRVDVSIKNARAIARLAKKKGWSKEEFTNTIRLLYSIYCESKF